jgi:4-amino-4-deoxy-L-arabinose transferase-like glycosyltransferase
MTSVAPSEPPVAALERRLPRSDLILLAVIAVVGLGLRLWMALDQSTFGDELFTYLIVTVPGFPDVVHGIQATETTPPAFYTLAWLSQKLGDPLFFQRLPSLVAATLTMPALYVLGARTVGRTAALLAVAAFAISPFAIFYGSEARAYATLTFFEVAAAVALLHALDRGAHRGWWVAFWAAASGAALTHYTGLPALLVLGAWALWARRDRARQVIVAYLAVGLTVAVWLPFAHKNVATAVVNAFYPATLENIVAAPVRALFGYPVPVRLDVVPGVAPLVVLFAVAGAGVFGYARRFARERGLRDELLLIAALALASPVALLVYGVVGADLYAPRNVQASLPAALLLIAGGVAALPRRAAIAAGCAWLAALAVGVVMAVQPGQRRLDYGAAAAFVEQHARPGDAVVEVEAFPVPGPLRNSWEVHFDKPVNVLEADLDRGAIAAAGRTAPRVFLLLPEKQLGGLKPGIPPELAGRRIVERRVYRGQADLTVLVLARTP